MYLTYKYIKTLIRKENPTQV